MICNSNEGFLVVVSDEMHEGFFGLWCDERSLKQLWSECDWALFKGKGNFMIEKIEFSKIFIDILAKM